MESSKSQLPSTIRNIVWQSHFKKEESGLCLCCSIETISKANFECGHIVAKSKGGGNEVDNLKPVCSLCNKSMGAKNMKDFMAEYGLRKSKTWDDLSETKSKNLTDRLRNSRDGKLIPKKPKKLGFHEFRKNYKEKSPKATAQQISWKWKTLSAEEKEVWHARRIERKVEKSISGRDPGEPKLLKITGGEAPRIIKFDNLIPPSKNIVSISQNIEKNTSDKIKF